MAAEGRPHRAAQVLGAIEFARKELGVNLPEADREFLEQIIGPIRDQLSEDGFAGAYGKGRAMTLEQAIEYARQV